MLADISHKQDAGVVDLGSSEQRGTQRSGLQAGFVNNDDALADLVRVRFDLVREEVVEGGCLAESVAPEDFGGGGCQIVSGPSCGVQSLADL